MVIFWNFVPTKQEGIVWISTTSQESLMHQAVRLSKRWNLKKHADLQCACVAVRTITVQI